MNLSNFNNINTIPNQNSDKEMFKNLNNNNRSSTKELIKKQNAKIITNDKTKGKKIKKYFKEYLSTSPDEMEYAMPSKKIKEASVAIS